MRFYGFGNYYLSSLQQGLQAGHVVGELFSSHEHGTSKYATVHDWAKNHKTMVLLNGGNSASLAAIFDKFISLEQQGMNLPFAKFHEDEASLGGALTYVGIIVPQVYYEAAAIMRDSTHPQLSQIMGQFTGWEKDLMAELNTYRLAQ